MFVFLFTLCLYLQRSLLPLRAQRNPPSCPLQFLPFLCTASLLHLVHQRVVSISLVSLFTYQICMYLFSCISVLIALCRKVYCYHWVGTVDMGWGGLLLVHHRAGSCAPEERRDGVPYRTSFITRQDDIIQIEIQIKYSSFVSANIQRWIDVHWTLSNLGFWEKMVERTFAIVYKYQDWSAKTEHHMQNMIPCSKTQLICFTDYSLL